MSFFNDLVHDQGERCFCKEYFNTIHPVLFPVVRNEIRNKKKARVRLMFDNVM